MPQPVFDAIVLSAARLCGAIFSVVYLCDGDRFRIAATQNFTPEATSQIQQRQELKRPDRSYAAGRAILDRAIIHIHDALADSEYSREFALAGGWRAVLAVPLLRDGKPVGALSVAKAEPIPFSPYTVRRCVPSQTSRSSWLRTLLRRQSSLSKIPGCSTNCEKKAFSLDITTPRSART